MNPPRWILTFLMTGLAVATISVMGSLQERRLIAPNGSLIETVPVALQDAKILGPAPVMLAEMGLTDFQVGT